MAYSELTQAVTHFTEEFPWLKVAKYFERVDSTQNRILQFLPKDGDGAALVVSESQTKAVGRLGRPWWSPAGGVWFTLALPLKELTLTQVSSFSMVAALSVATALHDVDNLSCEIKWPNDIRYQGKKLGGILLTTMTKFRVNWLLIGIGINVNNDLSTGLAESATSIKAIRGQTQGRSRLIEKILENLRNAWEDFDRTGFGPYHKACEERLVGKGELTKISAGKKVFEGTMVGIDPQGSLLLQTGESTQTVNAGEIIG